MNGLLLVAECDGNRYEVVVDETVGYYVFRYVGDGPRTTHDYLQDDLEMAKSCAENEFDVPPAAWRSAAVHEEPAYNRVK